MYFLLSTTLFLSRDLNLCLSHFTCVFAKGRHFPADGDTPVYIYVSLYAKFVTIFAMCVCLTRLTQSMGFGCIVSGVVACGSVSVVHSTV